jgi:peptidoglycan/xylan/chitin deacetylase (PgdA/CDA1 family)
MTAWLIAAIERLPPRVRRIVVAVVALVLIGAAITALTIAPTPGTGARSSRPAPRAPARQTARHPSPQRLAPPVPGPELRRAHDAAERFLGSYLSFAYGRARAPAVTPVTPVRRAAARRSSIGAATWRVKRCLLVDYERSPGVDPLQRIERLEVVGLDAL